MNKTILANIVAAFSALSAGASIVVTRFVIHETNPVSLAFLRYLIATICLLPILYLGLRKRPISLSHILPIIILGSLLYTFFPWGFSASLQYTTSAYGAIALSTMPIPADQLGPNFNTPLVMVVVYFNPTKSIDYSWVVVNPKA